MTEPVPRAKVMEVFADVRIHRAMADLIRERSTNRHDVREIALAGLELRSCRSILDLGCGFGFFTEALADKIHSQALVTGVDFIDAYQPAFLDTCRRAGLEGRFTSAGVSRLSELTAASFDLVVCSYALYFFPEVIPDVARMLRPDGLFVVITHARNNMAEMIAAFKDVLRHNRMLEGERLPLERILGQFSADNGMDQLRPWFGAVDVRDYRNSLVFGPEDRSRVLEYFLFKSPLLLSSTKVAAEWTRQRLSELLQRTSILRDGFTMSKDDRIFVCSSPTA